MVRRMLRCCVPLLAVGWFLAAAAAQNSTQKIRVEPSPTAERAGSAIPWLDSMEAALQQARQRELPVFWYVPTLRGSPMDRTGELDRRMRAGPFSWPSTVELLRDRCVCLRLVPEGEVQRRYGLVRQKFLEPGWLLLDAQGQELARLDAITTLHPGWFEAPLRRLLGVPRQDFPCTPALQDVWRLLGVGDLAGCDEALATVEGAEVSDALAAEAGLLRGMLLDLQGREREARAQWAATAARHPDEPLAWKAAMEAEGHGPFCRGFEVFLPLPERVLRETAEGSRAPRGTFTLPQLVRRGVEFLAQAADGDGVCRDSIYDFGGTDSLANVHLAVSFLCGEALLQARSRAQAGSLDLGQELRAAVDAQLARLLRQAIDGDGFALEDRDEILWAQAYRIRFLARWAALDDEDGQRARQALGPAVAALIALQPESGVWFHEYGNAFAIATALQALAAAGRLGQPVDEGAVSRGLVALQQCRTEDGAYSYSHPGRRPPRATRIAAAGRMPLCELARSLWGKATASEVQEALAAAFEHHAALAAVRKYDDHADRHGYGGFFFWFDMLGRTEALMSLPQSAQRELWRGQQRKLILDLPEFDGCFVDSHELGRSYGTAMALLCLFSLDQG